MSPGSNKLRQNPGLARDPTGYISASIQCNTKHLTIQFSTSENALEDTNNLVVINYKYYNPRKTLPCKVDNSASSIVKHNFQN